MTTPFRTIADEAAASALLALSHQALLAAIKDYEAASAEIVDNGVRAHVRAALEDIRELAQMELACSECEDGVCEVQLSSGDLVCGPCLAQFGRCDRCGADTPIGQLVSSERAQGLLLCESCLGPSEEAS